MIRLNRSQSSPLHRRRMMTQNRITCHQVCIGGLVRWFFSLLKYDDIVTCLQLSWHTTNILSCPCTQALLFIYIKVDPFDQAKDGIRQEGWQDAQQQSKGPTDLHSRPLCDAAVTEPSSNTHINYHVRKHICTASSSDGGFFLYCCPPSCI